MGVDFFNYMKTYDQEKEKFVSENEDMIEEYNCANGTWVIEEMDECWRNLHAVNQKINPSTFFREAKIILKNSRDNYNGIDLIDLLNHTLSTDNIHTSLQSYFNDVKRCYDNLPEDSLEFTPENRDEILKSNLKMVISTAKGYQNMGCNLAELISAGNMGLCVAWDKYKPEHNVLRERLLKTLKDSPDELSKEYIDSLIEPFIKYGEIRDRYEKTFHEKRVYKKKEVERWVNRNVKKAKFSSVAALWIRAYILQELNSNSRIVKKPKSEIDKDFAKYGYYVKEATVPIDPLLEPDDNVTTLPTSITGMGNTLTFNEEGEEESRIDEEPMRIEFKKIMNRLMDGISARDRRIILKAFGIGLPRAMTPKEISEDERVSIVRVTQIITNGVEDMKANATPEDYQAMMEYLHGR